MQQDIDLLVQVVMKCLADTIIPALEDGDKVSCEQAQLCYQTLSGVQKLIPLRHNFTRASLKSTIDIAMNISKSMEPLDEPSSAALRQKASECQEIYEMSKITAEDVADADILLNEMTCEIAEQLDSGSDVLNVLIQSCEEKIDIQRAWCFDSGVESQDKLREFVKRFC